MDPVVLPILSIQNDFQNVINEVRDGFVLSENIWLSCYKSDLPSVHEKVNVALNQQSRKLELIPGDGVTLESTSNVRVYHQYNMSSQKMMFTDKTG